MSKNNKVVIVEAMVNEKLLPNEVVQQRNSFRQERTNAIVIRAPAPAALRSTNQCAKYCSSRCNRGGRRRQCANALHQNLNRPAEA